MFHIHWRQAGLILLFFCTFQTAFAQFGAKGNNYNFLDFQQKPYYFGITLAYNSSDFNIIQSKELIGHERIAVVEDVNGPGFNLGIVSNLKIGNYFDLRFLPTLSFAEKNVKYTLVSSKQPVTKKVESVLVELPFHVRYKSAPFHDIRLFVIGGIKYSYDVANNTRAKNADQLLKIAPTDFTWEAGAGIQFFFPFFIWSPEFKVSNGISNILFFNKELEESTVLEKVLSRAFTISMHFEG